MRERDTFIENRKRIQILPPHKKKKINNRSFKNEFAFASSLFESSQTLFWASFGLVDISNFELTGIKSYTRFWGLLMFGSYSVINVVVLLNLLIAMMSNSYNVISFGKIRLREMMKLGIDQVSKGYDQLPEDVKITALEGHFPEEIVLQHFPFDLFNALFLLA
ncbi:UNVERIFIED_CONTAM: trpl [Trichonephila clavipes]